MNSFRFSPELLQTRSEVISLLNDEGFEWLSHFGGVDPMHDIYGIEVCGIHQEEDAREIMKILINNFPNWKHHRIVLKDWGREYGWIARVSQHPEDFEQTWA